MITYISLLRGINVSGQKTVRMKDLVSLYESLGLGNVRTYVQSGNVIFSSPQKDTRELSGLIEKAVEETFGFKVAVLLRTPSELQLVISNNPFLKKPDIDKSKLAVTFLSDKPENSHISRIQGINDESDRFVIVNKEIYLYCPNGFARTKFSNQFFEKKLGVTATTRNWKTVNALLDIVSLGEVRQ